MKKKLYEGYPDEGFLWQGWRDSRIWVSLLLLAAVGLYVLDSCVVNLHVL